MIILSGIVDGVFNIIFRIVQSRLEAAPTCIDARCCVAYNL